MASSRCRRPVPERWLSGLLRAVPPAVFVLMLGMLVFRVSCGFDITDESYGILWSEQPARIQGWIYQFGYYTGWLYAFSGARIAVFRLLGMLILLAAAVCFSAALLRCAESRLSSDARRKGSLSFHALVLAGVLGFYQWWMLTPSYNWLVLVGLLVCAVGLLQAASPLPGPAAGSSRLPMLRNAWLAGAGLMLVFMGKPPAAAVLLPVIFLWAGIQVRLERKACFLGTVLVSAGFLVLVHALLVKGNLWAWAAGLREGLYQEHLLGGGHTVGEVLSKAWIQWGELLRRMVRLLWGWCVWVLLAAGAVRLAERRGREKLAEILLSGAVLIPPAWILVRLFADGSLARSEMGSSGLILLSGVLLVGGGVQLAGCPGEKRFRPAGFGMLVVNSLWLFCLAGIYAAGTNNPLSRQLADAGVFFVAGVGLAARWIGRATGREWTGAWISALLALALLVPAREALDKPYRLPAGIPEQTLRVEMLGRGGSLRVDPKTAEYVNGLKQVAVRAGWRCGMPLIDLTGASPGASVILDAEIPATPWLIGGYGGSDAFAGRVLELTPESCLRRAWILTAPEGRRAISPEVVSFLGFPDRYVPAGEVRTGHRMERQILWKPGTEQLPDNPDQGSD